MVGNKAWRRSLGAPNRTLAEQASVNMLITRPATRADFDAVGMEALPVRVRALTIEQDGKVLAVGGIVMDMPEGSTTAFCNLTKEAKPFGLSLHKAAVAMYREVIRLGIKRIVAQVDPDNPAAVRWVKRFGFEPIEIDGEELWLLCL